MIKYGVEKEEILEYCLRQVRLKKMTYEEAIDKLKKHGINMDVDELKGLQ